MNIKPLSLVEIEIISLKHTSLFDFCWNTKHYLAEYHNKNAIIKGLYINNDLIGFYIINENDLIDILLISVFLDYRKLGYGSILLNDIIQYSNQKQKNIILEVALDNQAALSLYEKYQFNKIGIRKKYYNNRDAYTLIREVDYEKI